MRNDRTRREQHPTLTGVGDSGKAPDTTPSASSTVAAGRMVGPYRLLERVGDGGMGEVWCADQLEPVRRRVALKLIKRGMDSSQVVARFDAERQALARMAHPAIARVFDAGTAPDGRPYFAMEYIEGVPITEYCDRNKLATRERLELFCRVCDGVQHAHQKAVMHRDLKPSNILVADRDGKAEPKIIDFGLAKATAQPLTESTLLTAMGAVLGTPAYMSPEQAEMGGQNIDTRTDVYSLGVLLYELLTGTLPFDLRVAGFDEFRRQVREVDPPRPSTRLSVIEDRTTHAATNRHSQPGALRRLIRGDLDWITMKALEKNRARRYDSPSQLATDLARFLQNEPVLAGPPSGLYRARKFARRHRVGVSAAATVVLALLSFATTTTLQAQRLAAERDRATRESEISGQTSRFLVGLFRTADPSRAAGITARELLDRGALEIDSGLPEPSVRARVMHAMGRVYGMLGLYAEAEPLQQGALDLRRSELGDDSPETLTSMNDLGRLYLEQARYADSESLITAALGGRTKRLGRDHPDTLATQHALAGVFWSQGRYDEAEPLLADVFASRRDLLGDDHPDTLQSAEDVATMHHMLGRYDEAEPLFLEVMNDRRRRLGRDHPDTLTSMAGLARFYREMSRYDEAEELMQNVLDNRRRVLGQDHPDTLVSIADLGALYRRQDRFADAERLHEDARNGRLRVLGDEHPATLESMVELADVYKAQGRLADALMLLERVRATATRLLGAEHPRTLDWSVDLASALFSKGDHGRALDLIREVLAVERELLGETHPYTLHAMTELAAVLVERSPAGDEAERLLLDVIDIQSRTLGENNYQTLMSRHILGRFYWRTARYAAAQVLLEEAADGLEKLFGKQHPGRLRVLRSLARNTRNLDSDEAAEPLFEEVLARQRELLGDTHPDTLTTLHALAILYQQTERPDEAEKIHLDVAATAIGLGPDRPGWAPQESYYQVACAAAISGDPDKAFEFLDIALASDEHGQFPYWMSYERDLRPLFKDPRWPVTLEKVGRHRMRVNGFDLGGTAMMRSAAFSYDTLGQIRKAFGLAVEVWESRLKHQGEDHVMTRSARNELTVLAWTNQEDQEARQYIGRLGALDPVPAEEQDGLKSTRGEKLRSGIVFVNSTDRDLDYYWINPEGELLQRGTVPAGTSDASSSGPRQVWKFGDVVFVTTEQTSKAIVSE